MPERRIYAGINSYRRQSSGHQRRRKGKDRTDGGDQLYMKDKGSSGEMK